MREAVAIVTAFEVDSHIVKDLITEAVEDALASRDVQHLAQLIGALGLMAHACLQVYAEHTGADAQEVRHRIIRHYTEDSG